MKAAFITETGEPEVIQYGDLEMPEVGPGKVRRRSREGQAASVRKRTVTFGRRQDVVDVD